jgi:histidinol dehydrogenase
MQFFDNGNKKVLSDEILSFLKEEEKDDIAIEESVRQMLVNVRENGFAAVQDYTKKFDNFDLTSDNFRVSREEIDELAAKISPELSASLEIAVERVKAFHECQKEQGFETVDSLGNKMGQRVVPLDSVAVYVPGGRALYPSTFYMTVIPALIAGVKRIVVLTPPRTFKESPEIARLIQLLGITEVYRGAGCALVLAAAHGLPEIPKVDKIVGPGNAYVAEAKKQVFGKVSIDMIAGPSEILVVADDTCNPEYVAADLLSQAEHDKMASAVLVTDSMEFAQKVSDALERQIPTLLRKEIARTSIDNHGKIIVADNLSAAIEIANEIAPEHLELCVEEPFAYLEQIKHAGSVFLGKYCPEALGDYFAGPNHTLPTSGTAKFSSPLSVDDFVKKTQFSYYTKEALDKVADKVAMFAMKEGLEAHARSATIRKEK